MSFTTTPLKMAMSKETWITENEENNSITSGLRKRDYCIASTDDASVRVEQAVPFRLHADSMCDPAHWVVTSMAHCGLVNLIKTCGGKTRATTQLFRHLLLTFLVS